MEWYHYVIIGAAVIILILLFISLFKGSKSEHRPHDEKVTPMETKKPTIPEEKEVEAVEKPEPVNESKEKAKKEPLVEEKEDDDKIAKYHVSQNKDKKSARFKEWRVRKEGSNKTIKYFQTQKEAIEYAEQLAESAGSSIVIHKVDGSIRKQDYTSKDD